MALSTTHRIAAGSVAALTLTGMTLGAAHANDAVAPDTSALVYEGNVASVATAANTVNFTINVDQTRAGMWLEQYKALRGQMWDLNPPFTEVIGSPQPLQTVAAKYGLDTKEKYMNAVQWDATLEQEAIQRAGETSIYASHTRPDGSSAAGVIVPGNDGSRGENLAWGATADQSIAAWSTLPIMGGKSEYDWLVAANGYYTSANGHLWTILDPSIKSMAVSHATNINGANHTTAMRLSRAASVNTGTTGTVGQLNFSISADPAVYNHFAVATIAPITESAQGKAQLVAQGAPNNLWRAMYMLKPSGTWSVADPSIAAIDPATGVFTGLKAGTTQVIFTTTSGDIAYAGTITINAAPVVEVPVEPELPVEPVEPEVPVEPEQPVEPVEPETPVDPEQPVEPVEPETPVDPEQPAEPEVPVEPVEPETPVDPEQPDIPVEPVDPEVPAEPEVPVEPVDPEQPEIPVEPVDPVQPEVPVEPVNPEQPIEPVQPEIPVEPEVPVDPVDPEAPVDPVQPEVPEQPVEPVDPVQPEVPVEPEVPSDPAQPVDPGAPVEPEVPAEPETPVETPAEPVTPETPESPVVSDPADNSTVDYGDPGTAPIKMIGDEQGETVTIEEFTESAQHGVISDETATSEETQSENADSNTQGEERLAETGANQGLAIAGGLTLALGAALVAANRRRNITEM